MSNSLYHQNDIFALNLKVADASTYMRMEMYETILKTRYIPQTSTYLERFLPSIFLARCFNTRKYPFRREVKDTQVGHLFEHILLEYLSHEKKRLGHKKVVFNGLTSWDWDKDMRGVFHIKVDCGLEDIEIMPRALYQSIELFCDVVKSAKSKQMII